MALDDDAIKYSDIIQPDGSLDNLINKLDEISKSYAAVVETIKVGADKIASSLSSASGATKKGKEVISETAEAANRLERAYRELAIAESEEGKMIAQLKALTQDANKASVAELRALEAKAGSYDKLQQELKEYVNLYKSLTAAEREDAAMGKELINQILEYKNQIKALDAEIKPHIEKLTRLQKAENELAFLRSEEGKQLLNLQKQIRAVRAEYADEKAVVDPLAEARKKLAQAQSAEYQELQNVNRELQKQQKIAKLTAIIDSTREDTYERLSAQYALGKIRLAEFTQAELTSTDAGKRQVEQLDKIYAKMKLLQEATGYYGLGVGQYSRAFEGLSFSVSQVIRELPAATISLNTFFLAISNNIPMVVDEINKLRKAGTSGINIIKGIGTAIFSWPTLLIAGLTALSMYGDEIIAWVGKLFKAKKAALDFNKVQRSIIEELNSTNASFGNKIVTLRKLTDEYKALKTEAEKTQWIEDNKAQFDELEVSITGINDAENLFVSNTQAYIDALKLRAKAAAATKLAAEKYEEILTKENELAQKRKERGEQKSSFMSGIIAAAADVTAPGATPGTFSSEGIYAEQTRRMEERREAELAGLNAEVDAYYALAQEAENAAAAKLRAAGIKPAIKEQKTGTTGTEGEKGRQVIDMLNNERLKAEKNYNKALTEQEREEFKKRRDAAEDAYNEKVLAAQNANAKLKRILADEDNDYRDLTDDQKKQVEATIQTNEKAITEYKNVYLKTLDDIAKDEAIYMVQTLIAAQELRLKTLKEGSDEEFQLRQEMLKNQMKLALLQNAKLPASQQQDPELIKQGYVKQGELAVSARFMEVFDQQQALEDARFNAVVHSEGEITRYRLTQEMHRWKQLIILAELGGLDWSQAQIDAAKATVEGISAEIGRLDKQNNFMGKVAEYGLFGALFAGWGSKKGMDNQQIQDAIAGFNTFANSVISDLQAILQAEVEYAERMKELADERVEAAQRAYDAEVEGRNNGYANNVATAKKELEQEKKNQQQKQRLLEEAQRRQEALNTITQASSLITASAQLWQAFSSIPFIGPALALAAIATMWGSFAAAKVKARQVTASSEEYGEGGLEFLEGGSHASGNDIDLGVNNSRNKRMRAEGGEALAIINKRNTRRYKGILPDVIDSFNKGTFEDKYLNAFGSLPDSYFIGMKSNTDLTRLEAEVAKIRKQGEVQYFLGSDGTIIELKGNVKRIIKS